MTDTFLGLIANEKFPYTMQYLLIEKKSLNNLIQK